MARQLEYQQSDHRADRRAPEIGQKSDASRQGQVPSGRNIVLDVITGKPVHGGFVNGAKKSLSEHIHVVNVLGVEDRCRPSSIPFVSFSEVDIKGIVFPHDDPPEGSIVLQVRIGEGAAARDVMTEFIVVDVPSAYNVIVGRPMIHDVQAFVSTYHLTMIHLGSCLYTVGVRKEKEPHPHMTCPWRILIHGQCRHLAPCREEKPSKLNYSRVFQVEWSG
uniref:Uncharacterized protein n=1 Tax=Chenopodium quinoa TaxID=63459 RepID=A0A803N105_CHEQI